MDRLLFSLAQMECAAATWLLATGERSEAERRLETAVELLSGIEQARGSWRDPTKRRHGDRRRGG